MVLKYIKPFSATLRDDNGGRLATLLWGDPVHLQDGWDATGNQMVQAYARETPGWLNRNDLSDDSLLEIYVIDVGQGDSILFKTPNGQWHLLDAGAACRDQMTLKGAPNFIRWKFYDDLLLNKISLENVIISHPDADHFGGLIDLFAGVLPKNNKTFNLEAKNFYHSGLGRYAAEPKLGETQKDKVAPFPINQGLHRQGTFIVDLLDDKASFANPTRAFEDGFSEYALLVANYPQNVHRLSSDDQFLPGYEAGAVKIKVLGPIVEHLESGKVGLRSLGDESLTRNGHSVVIRLDYGQARFLLTGDLNDKSHKLLLSYLPKDEFKVDVAKACHHGSDIVALEFIQAMNARVTVISSGDNEDFSHPRPLVLGASSRYGRESTGIDGQTIPPLVYSTELARSVNLAYVASLQIKIGEGATAQTTTIKPENVKAKPDLEESEYRQMEYLPLATNLVYGLVNVRSDGKHVLCATMEEKGNDFDIQVIKVA